MTRIVQFLNNYRNAILAWLLIAALIIVGIELGVDRTVLGFTVLIIGLLGEAFTALMAWISLVPVVGPLIAKVLALPFFWLLNGVGYLASVVAIKQGFARDVINTRVLTITLLIGVTIGYILGKLL
ncbi:MAG: hypothetical protein HY563_07145 [Ignavibacteriales bacterium]|nr:hypothetical protein [Ignavibacteriales bacterium]